MTGRSSIPEAPVLEPSGLWNAGCDSAFPRHISRPSDASSCPSIERGHRECRCTNAPAASRANKKAHELVTTGTPKHPAFPVRWCSRLIRALPGVPGLLATVAGVMRSIIASLIPASGDQDHTISPHALSLRSSCAAQSVHRIPRFSRGAFRDRHGRWARGAMDACSARDECAGKRTAKSCGPDFSTLKSTWR